MRKWSSWCRAVKLALVVATSSASAYMVGPAVPLEELARTADVVCKATVFADHSVTDDWFDPISGFEVRETELRVVSIVKGMASNVIRFRHYTPSSGMRSYAPQSYTFATGRTYLVFAAEGVGGTYRQLTRSHTLKMDQGVLLAADTKPHRGTTVSETAWAELLALLESPDSDDVVEAIRQLDEMSGGRDIRLKDFERSQALAAIQPLITVKNVTVATAAVSVFGRESPYFDDAAAPYWLAGIGKGTIAGIGARRPGANPAADIAVKELLNVATGDMTPELRALAVRALARSPLVSVAMVAEWLRDPSIAVRRAAVLASVELRDREPIMTASTDDAPDIRHAAALAIGFAQDPSLVPLLNGLLQDPAPNVRAAAALSLLAFAPDQAAPVLKANLTSDFRPLFINALARADPQPYLVMLAEVIEQRLEPTNWWGGAIPAGDSWTILFGFVKARPAAELTGGTLDSSLDALERMQWFSSAEPRNLYALYLSRGLLVRAQQFRDTTRKSVPYDVDYFFDMADRDPAAYIQ